MNDEAVHSINQYRGADHGGALIMVSKSFRVRREPSDYGYMLKLQDLHVEISQK